MLALDDITVLDFSTMLPGSLCTLLLAEAGARVIKIERPGGADIRKHEPKLGDGSVGFTLLNRGKESLEVDLKRPSEVERLTAMIKTADVLVGQFRPGVMQRLRLAQGWGHGQWPKPETEQLTGGSSRYQVYRTADGQGLTVAYLEDKFWRTFLTLIGLEELADVPDSTAVRERVATTLGSRSAQDWLARLGDADTCVCTVVSLEDAVCDPHFVERGIFPYHVSNVQGASIPALPVPIVSGLRAAPGVASAPILKKWHSSTIRRG